MNDLLVLSNSVGYPHFMFKNFLENKILCQIEMKSSTKHKRDIESMGQ